MITNNTRSKREHPQCGAEQSTIDYAIVTVPTRSIQYTARDHTANIHRATRRVYVCVTQLDLPTTRVENRAMIKQNHLLYLATAKSAGRQPPISGGVDCGGCDCCTIPPSVSVRAAAGAAAADVANA